MITYPGRREGGGMYGWGGRGGGEGENSPDVSGDRTRMRAVLYQG